MSSRHAFPFKTCTEYHMPPALSARQVILRDVERPLKDRAPVRKSIYQSLSVTYTPQIYVLFSSLRWGPRGPTDQRRRSGGETFCPNRCWLPKSR
ncbi:hypothetical protein IG631_23996 [Alternaria alternata]|nr:hypothetical protein IG631_23996 [Alternaria alternata]